MLYDKFMEQKTEQIKKSLTDYCNTHLDTAYLKICLKVHQDLLKNDKNKPDYAGRYGKGDI